MSRAPSLNSAVRRGSPGLPRAKKMPVKSALSAYGTKCSTLTHQRYQLFVRRELKLTATVPKRTYYKSPHNPEEIPELKEIRKLTDTIEILWQSKCISEAQRQVYIKSMLTHKLPALQREAAALKGGHSLVQILLQTIEAREANLNQLRKLNEELVTAGSREEMAIECAERLQGHRMFTLSVVENILKWKTELSRQAQTNKIFWNSQITWKK